MGKGQSLLSQWISELEADSGVILLERSGNRAVPTSQAWKWLLGAQQACSELEVLARRIEMLWPAGLELQAPLAGLQQLLAQHGVKNHGVKKPRR